MKIQTKITWQRQLEEIFLDGNYSRNHQWILDGGLIMEASASPDVVPIPMSDPTLMDPEEAFISSISSCHMLFFLAIAARKKFVVDTYEDNPEAIMGKLENNRTAVLCITLQPKITFTKSNCPTEKMIDRIHKIAHANCFLANSVNTKIIIN